MLLGAGLVLVLILALLWVAVPAWYGLPPIASTPDRIRRALAMAEPKPGEILYDLGSGHGRVLVIAARDFSLKAVGVEIGPVQRLISRINAWAHGVGSQVRVLPGDLRRADLGGADIVYAYLTSRYADGLSDKFERQLKPGARMVTVAFDLPRLSPHAFDREHLIYLYRNQKAPHSNRGAFFNSVD